MEKEFFLHHQVLPIKKGGRLALILKISLPEIRGEEGELCRRFNSFYKELSEECRRSAEALSDSLSESAGVAVVRVIAKAPTVDGEEISVSRKISITIPGMEPRELSSIDRFDSSLGTLIRQKKKQKRQKNEPKPPQIHQTPPKKQ